MNIKTTILSLHNDATALAAAKAALHSEADALYREAKQAQTEAIHRSLPGHPYGAAPVDTVWLAKELAALRSRAETLKTNIMAFRELIPEEVKTPINSVWRSHATYMRATQWEGWLEAGWTPAWGTPETGFDETAADYVYGVNFPVQFSGNASRRQSAAALFGRGPMAAGTVAPPKGGELTEALIALAGVQWFGPPCEIACTEGVLGHIRELNNTANQNKRRIRRHLRKQGVTPLG